MTVKRMDDVLIDVGDREATKAFFIELGLKLEMSKGDGDCDANSLTFKGRQVFAPSPLPSPGSIGICAKKLPPWARSNPLTS